MKTILVVLALVTIAPTVRAAKATEEHGQTRMNDGVTPGQFVIEPATLICLGALHGTRPICGYQESKYWEASSDVVGRFRDKTGRLFWEAIFQAGAIHRDSYCSGKCLMSNTTRS